jgi:hypothetical protein
VTPEQAAIRLAALACNVRTPLTVEMRCDRPGHGQRPPAIGYLECAAGDIRWRPKVRPFRPQAFKLDENGSLPAGAGRLIGWNPGSGSAVPVLARGEQLYGQCKVDGRVAVDLDRLVRRAEEMVAAARR